MQVQAKSLLREISDGESYDFDLIQSNGLFRNVMFTVASLAAATYTIRVLFKAGDSEIPYTDLDVNHALEQAVDMLVLTPQNRFLPPNLFPSIPNVSPAQENEIAELGLIPICRIANNTGTPIVFYVAGTWEVAPPGMT